MSLNLFSHCLSYFGIQNMYHIDMPQRYVLALIKKKTTRCHRVVEFIIPMFLNCSTCLGDTPPIIRSSKTVIAASVFTYVFGCRPLRWLSRNSVPTQPETCWTVTKHWNNKFYYMAASCWFFLWDLYYDTRIHEHQESEIVSISHNVREFGWYISWSH